MQHADAGSHIPQLSELVKVEPMKSRPMTGLNIVILEPLISVVHDPWP